MNLCRSLRAALLSIAGCFASPDLTAQICYDFGSTPVPSRWSESPLPLGCAAAPAWPQWRLFTPWHRAPTPHAGFRPGNAHAWPVILIRYRCTGWFLLPVVIDHVRTNGYVIDQPEYACESAD